MLRPKGAAWRGDRAAECGGLENRCAPSAPGVRIPLSPLNTAIPTKAHQGVMSQVSLAAFSLPVSPAAIECNLMILQFESQSRIVPTLRSTS